MANYFDRFCNEGNAYINHLANKLGHPEEKEKVIRLLKATLHTIRDRIIVTENLNVLAQLPLFLKAVYIDQWTYHEKPLQYKTIEGFLSQVEHYQQHHGEHAFNWKEPTIDLVKIILNDLKERYISEGAIRHIMCQLPEEIRSIF